MIRLVVRPGGVILDPFCGSGTSLVAAVYEGDRALGIEREAPFVAIARARAADAEGPLFAPRAPAPAPPADGAGGGGGEAPR